jgi:DNA-directed RNA polymerase subunit RPC12/RpoP
MKGDDADIIADERMLTCGRCKKSVSISKIQYLPRGDGSVIALCSSCREQKAVKTEIKPKPKSPSASQKINYLCTRCNYKFSFDPSGNANLKCPYCSKADKLKDTSIHSAGNLLKSNDF